jgi:hypothetical protein
METSTSLRTLKIMPRNLNEIVCSRIRLQTTLGSCTVCCLLGSGGGAGGVGGDKGVTQHDFSLAWLEAASYCSGSGHGTTRNEPVQKMLSKLCPTLFP